MDGHTRFTVGAGVVPMSICPKTGLPHLLLGQERYVRGWSGSLKVSGFEGGNKKHESPEQNAARECHEETLGLVYESESTCTTDLVNGNFVMKIAIGSRTKTHVTYLTLVPWIPDVGPKFKEIRSFLVELDLLASKFESASRKMRTEDTSELTGLTEHDVAHTGLSQLAIANAHAIRTKLDEKLASSPHGAHAAITVTREGDVLMHVKVNTDYLEKIEVQYVSVKSAIEMLNRRRSIIRPFFRPVLAAICDRQLDGRRCPDAFHCTTRDWAIVGRARRLMLNQMGPERTIESTENDRTALCDPKSNDAISP